MTKSYFVNTDYGPVEVFYEGAFPKCLYCEELVVHESCDGPAVCPCCDMGNNKDGSKWSLAQYQKMRENFKRNVQIAIALGLEV